MIRLLTAVHRVLRRLIRPGDTAAERRELDAWIEARFRDAASQGPLELLRVARTEFADLIRGGETGGRVRGLGLDLRAARRRMARRPGISVLLALTLGGATAASVVVLEVGNALFRQPLTWPEADRLLRLDAADPSRGRDGETFRVVEWEAFQEHPALEAVVGSFDQAALAQGPDEALRVSVRRVTPGWFEFFGASWSAGRGFRAGDDPDAAAAVLSQGAWTRLVGGEPRSGATLDLDGTPFSVLGVLDSDFVSVHGETADIYIHHGLGSAGWTGRWLTLWARSARALEPTRLAVDLSRRMADIDAAAGRPAGWEARAEPLRQSIVAASTPTLRPLATTVLALLLLSSAGAGTVLAGRVLTGGQEITMRRALGGSGLTSARPFLLEVGLITITALVLGALGARGALTAIDRWSPVASSLPGTPGPGATFMTSLLWSAAVLVVVGLLPALLVLRGMAGGALRHGSGPRRPVLGAAVALQTGLALAVLVVTGQVAGTEWLLSAVDPGVRPESVWYAEVHLASGADDLEARILEVQRRVEARPEVSSAGVGSDVPLGGAGAWGRAWTESMVAGEVEGISVLQRAEGPGWFGTLGATLGEEPRDPRADGVTVSRALAEALWPGQDPVGRRMTVRRSPEPEDWWTVTRVVADLREEGLAQAGRPQYSRPLEQTPQSSFVLVARVAEGAEVTGILRDAIREAAPGAAVEVHGRLQGLIDDALLPVRFAGRALALLGLVALALVVAGTYGMTTLQVAAQQRESGVRLALGMAPSRLFGHAVLRAIRWNGVGVLLGLALALLGVRAAGGIVPGVEVSGGWSWWAPALALLLAAAGAAAGPALRASRTDPVRTLRSS